MQACPTFLLVRRKALVFMDCMLETCIFVEGSDTVSSNLSQIFVLSSCQLQEKKWRGEKFQFTNPCFKQSQWDFAAKWWHWTLSNNEAKYSYMKVTVRQDKNVEKPELEGFVCHDKVRFQCSENALTGRDRLFERRCITFSFFLPFRILKVLQQLKCWRAPASWSFHGASGLTLRSSASVAFL